MIVARLELTLGRSAYICEIHDTLQDTLRNQAAASVIRMRHTYLLKPITPQD